MRKYKWTILLLALTATGCSSYRDREYVSGLYNRHKVEVSLDDSIKSINIDIRDICSSMDIFNRTKIISAVYHPTTSVKEAYIEVLYKNDTEVHNYKSTFLDEPNIKNLITCTKVLNIYFCIYKGDHEHHQAEAIP